MHKLSVLLITFFAIFLFSTCIRTATALECPDFINEDWDDIPTCAWLRNDTDKRIAFGPWQIYQGPGDLNDDYWRAGFPIPILVNGSLGPLYMTELSAGQLNVVVGLDNDGWTLGTNQVRGRSAIFFLINGQDGELTYHFTDIHLYMEAYIVGGVVNNFRYSLDGSNWVDGFAQTTHNIDGTDYIFVVQDKWNYRRAVFDVFFTFSSQTANEGNMGYIPPDTQDDPLRLNVMNYNTYLLIGPSGLGGKQDYCERAKRIYDNKDRIFANVDILVMQELASQDNCTPDAEQLATGEFLCCGEDKPFRDRTLLLNGEPTVNGDYGPTETGGVVIMSRYPDSLHGNNVLWRVDYLDDPFKFGEDDEVHYIFRNDAGECDGHDLLSDPDCLMDKGFLRVKFTKHVELMGQTISQDYYIIGTHFDAYPDAADKAARRLQSSAINRHINELPNNVPILIVGDLNTEQEEIDDIIHNWLGAEYAPNDPYLKGLVGPLQYSEYGRVNYYSLLQYDYLNTQNYDWVLYSKHGLAPTKFEYRYMPIRDKFWGRGDLSDHEAVIAELEFNYPDTDADGVFDIHDNCTLVANPDQRDTNGDGYGNICDADLNDDGGVNFADMGILRQRLFSADPDADFNGDGGVNFGDMGILRQYLFGPPGPSGLVP